MSRIGKRPIAIPDGVKVTLTDSKIKTEGPKGVLEYKLFPNIRVKIEQSKRQVIVEGDYQGVQDRINHGTARSIIQNMIKGVSAGYEERMEIIGVGYKAAMEGKTLSLSLGFSHPVKIALPAGINITVPNPNLMIIQGADKQLVGNFAAGIKAIKPSEPYNLKGIKFVDEIIKRKTGKTFVSGTT